MQHHTDAAPQDLDDAGQAARSKVSAAERREVADLSRGGLAPNAILKRLSETGSSSKIKGRQIKKMKANVIQGGIGSLMRDASIDRRPCDYEKVVQWCRLVKGGAMDGTCECCECWSRGASFRLDPCQSLASAFMLSAWLKATC